MSFQQNPDQGKELFTVTTANAQDILIIVSAGLSFVKSLMAVGTYSYFHVMFALIELACTGLAFSIFILEDYLGDDEESLYGDDVMLYLLSFVSGCMIEWVDVLVTYQTVAAYKRLKRIEERDVIEEAKKVARCVYTCTLIISIVFAAIIPLIAFSKANFVTEYFSPTEFSEKNGRFLLAAIILPMPVQFFFACLFTFNAANSQAQLQLLSEPGKIQAAMNLLSIVSAILLYIVLSRVSGREAGGLSYLVMINVMQGIEFGAETARHMVWLALEHSRPSQAQEDQTEDLEGQNGGTESTDSVK